MFSYGISNLMNFNNKIISTLLTKILLPIQFHPRKNAPPLNCAVIFVLLLAAADECSVDAHWK
jgi:hypothetical protein